MIDSHRCYTCYIFELQEWNWNFRFSRQKFQGLHFLFCASYKRYFYASFYTTYIFDSFYIQWYISLHRRLHRSKWIEIDSILTLGINHFCYKVIWKICDILFQLEIPLSFIRLCKTQYHLIKGAFQRYIFKIMYLVHLHLSIIH